MSWLQAFWRWLTGLVRRRPARAHRTEMMDDVPDRVSPATVYVVGEGGHLWCVVMLCPCGCREVIQLNLLPEARPRWEVTVHADGTATLFPSVARVRGCRSHFFVRRGVIQWCPVDQLNS